jgi:presenilin 1
VLTLVLLAVVGKALPALPISIALGMAVFFALDLFALPFTNTLSQRLVFV